MPCGHPGSRPARVPAGLHRGKLRDLVAHDDLAGVLPFHRNHPGALRIREREHGLALVESTVTSTRSSCRPTARPGCSPRREWWTARCLRTTNRRSPRSPTRSTASSAIRSARSSGTGRIRFSRPVTSRARRCSPTSPPPTGSPSITPRAACRACCPTCRSCSPSSSARSPRSQGGQGRRPRRDQPVGRRARP